MVDSYRFFDTVVKHRIVLSPSMVRFVFTGEDVAGMAFPGPDQRIKMFFPEQAGQRPELPRGPDWIAAFRALDDASKPAMRTYTIRALRADVAEVDIDFAVHGSIGPASRWALEAKEGNPMVLFAPDARAEHDSRGYEWHPPQDVDRVLIVADESALPAVASILDHITASPSRPRIEALIEVPTEADRLPLAALEGLSVRWLPRDHAYDYGQRLLEALRDVPLPRHGADAAVTDIDVDNDILWEQASGGDGAFYAWIAGEAAAVLDIRRHLVNERGVDRKAMNLMGYWRKGRSLD